MPRTAPLSASAFDAIHASFDAPEAESECSYCGDTDAPLAAAADEILCPACRAELATERATERIAAAPSFATYAVARTAQTERFDRRTSHVVAKGLTKGEADTLARLCREGEPDMVFNIFTSPLSAQMEAAGFTPETHETAASGAAVRETVEAPPMPSVTGGAAFPRLVREDAIEADAADVHAHLSACDVRFPIGRKLEQSEAYSIRRGGSSLRIPSKLSGTAGMQDRIERVARHMEVSGAASLATVLHVTPESDGHPSRIAVLAAPNGEARNEDDSRRGAILVGYVQAKHEAWLGPLLSANGAGTVTREATPVRIRLTAVTGGTSERPTRGVNVEVVGVPEAVRGLWRDVEREASEEAAYATGNRAAVEAMID